MCPRDHNAEHGGHCCSDERCPGSRAAQRRWRRQAIVRVAIVVPLLLVQRLPAAATTCVAVIVFVVGADLNQLAQEVHGKREALNSGVDAARTGAGRIDFEGREVVLHARTLAHDVEGLPLCRRPKLALLELEEQVLALLTVGRHLLNVGLDRQLVRLGIAPARSLLCRRRCVWRRWSLGQRVTHTRGYHQQPHCGSTQPR
mmetsp:Transcript_11151/g.30552  ORF Transcript_11151/g.30552 Transcript_11151/m.30552 type:complete len:201 (+) Transcript_11151:66-668(+)